MSQHFHSFLFRPFICAGVFHLVHAKTPLCVIQRGISLLAEEKKEKEKRKEEERKNVIRRLSVKQQQQQQSPHSHLLGFLNFCG